MKMVGFFSIEDKCFFCGKTFMRSSEWVYYTGKKYRRNYCCSYSCFLNASDDFTGRKKQKAREIVKMSLSGEEIKKYDSIKDAVIEMDLPSEDHLRRCLSGKIESAYGFCWVYA